MNKVKRIFERIYKIKSEKGLKGICEIGNKHIFKYLRCYYYKLFKKNRKFKFRGKEYNYFYHPYNFSWETERTIEVPIILNFVTKFKNDEILEVGNVLSHYIKFKHDILDKYEKDVGVINEDVVDFRPNKKYDLIISISTLEHVGWDEVPKQKNKILFAIKNLKKLIKSKGVMVTTIPLGHNLYMDDLIKKGKAPFNEQYFLKKISKNNKWKEISKKEINNPKYGRPFPYANVVFVGITKIKK